MGSTSPSTKTARSSWCPADTGRTAAYGAGERPPGVQPIHIVGGASGRLAQAGDFTTTFTGEVPGCQDEVTFIACAQGPDGELNTERDADESTLGITIPMFEFEVTIDIAAGNDTRILNRPGRSSSNPISTR